MVELTVGEVARRSGMSVSALHFYERKGLIRSLRTGGNQRRFSRDVLRRLAVIRVAQQVGVPLEGILAAFAGLPDARTPTRADWQHVSVAWRANLDERIRSLEQLRNQLADCIGCGCLSLKRCKLANPGDTLAAQGNGPRRWIKAKSS
jgi:MerR family transcriptional regulator, redox-sensitive transcriptional activator SoxR